ncbi:hypothetical protein GCM10025883_40810 [Mobilicoccus caccae]|uniref:DUF4112 domain-containing protein n=2 Tax=Mobilicoccus caccae TaxID=1859295 RepID=A0ABQ6IX73_9MICO|nr:hypothetical protein GCM10025883_40810 [Mobilicoccus caccae]
MRGGPAVARERRGTPYADQMSSRHRRAPEPAPAASTTSSRLLARLMDDMVRIPGTRFGLGLDALIGLIPGIGDVAGTAISSVILADAVRNRVPISVLLLMGWNLLFDAILGLIPGVGDVADAAHRANLKNLRLLEKTVAQGRTVDASAKGYVVRAVLVVAVILLVLIAFAAATIWVLLRLIGAVG